MSGHAHAHVSTRVVLIAAALTVAAASAELLGSRSTDLRLAEGSRPTRDEKREAQKDRYAARAATQEELEAERRSGLWHLAADSDSDSDDA